MCACGQKANTEVITSNVAQAIIDEQRRQTQQDQYEAMLASAGQAISNADSGATTIR